MKHQHRTPTAIARPLLASFVLGFAASTFAAPSLGTGSDANASFRYIDNGPTNHPPSAKLRVVVRRGQWRDSTDNSLAAIKLAVKEGAEIMETDLRLAEDDVHVLMQDVSVDRITDVKGHKDEPTPDEIKKLPLSKGLVSHKATVTNHTIPTLGEATAALKNRAMVNLDEGWDYREQILLALEAALMGALRSRLRHPGPPLPFRTSFLGRRTRRHSLAGLGHLPGGTGRHPEHHS